MLADIRFTPGSDADAVRGLLGYVQLRYGPLHLDGITLRRTRTGSLTLSWPGRRDRTGAHHALVRPISDAAREELEEAVFEELRRQEGQE